MLRLTEVKLPIAHPEGEIQAAILNRLCIPADELISYTIARRGYDARKPDAILFAYTLDVEVKNEAAILKRLKGDRHLSPSPDTRYQFVAQAPKNLKSRPVVVGMGPAGLFAALILAQSGFRPIVLERGKAVRERTKDTFGLWRKGVLNPESNVQFGEGGAGTFSDGKLHSQIKDPKHYGRKVLTEFVKAGAPEEILYVSKPHIGTFRLVSMVEKMRATIIELGGEIRFQSRVDDIEIEEGQVRAVVLADGERIATDHLVMAIGHSARDTVQMLHQRGVYMEAKPFSIGFRIEHPQSLIDRCRLGKNAGNPLARRSRLQTGPPLQERALCVQLLHVPGRAGGRCRIRARARGDQWHEPVFPQRAQCQQRHRGGHHPRGLSGRPAGGHRVPAQMGRARLRTRRSQL